MVICLSIQDMTDFELEQKIYETEETHDSVLRTKLLNERNRRNREE